MDSLLKRKLDARIALDEKLLADKRAAETEWKVVPDVRLHVEFETKTMTFPDPYRLRIDEKRRGK